MSRFCSSSGRSVVVPPAGPILRSHRLLRALGYGALVSLGGFAVAVVSWPFIDGKILPAVYTLTLRRGAVPDCRVPSADEAGFMQRHGLWGCAPRQHAKPDCHVADEALGRTVDQLFAMVSPSARSEIVLLHGPTGCGKTTTVHTMLARRRDGQPILYVSCRNFVEPAPFLYGMLTHALNDDLGVLSTFFIAYHKLYNGIVDLLTMNQQHAHVSNILFCQSLGHIRAALLEWKGRGGPKPILVFDHGEQLVANHHHHDGATVGSSEVSAMGGILSNWLVRVSHDEDLCHVLVTVDSDVLEPCLTSNGCNPPTKLSVALPTLCKHASHRWMTSTALQLRDSQGLASDHHHHHRGLLLQGYLAEVRRPHATPFLYAVVAIRLLHGGADFTLTAADVSSSLGVDLDDATAALNALADAGLASRVMGTRLPCGARSASASVNTFTEKRAPQPVRYAASDVLRGHVTCETIKQASYLSLAAITRSVGGCVYLDVPFTDSPAASTVVNVTRQFSRRCGSAHLANEHRRGAGEGLLIHRGGGSSDSWVSIQRQQENKDGGRLLSKANATRTSVTTSAATDRAMSWWYLPADDDNSALLLRNGDTVVVVPASR